MKRQRAEHDAHRRERVPIFTPHRSLEPSRRVEHRRELVRDGVAQYRADAQIVQPPRAHAHTDRSHRQQRARGERGERDHRRREDRVREVTARRRASSFVNVPSRALAMVMMTTVRSTPDDERESDDDDDDDVRRDEFPPRRSRRHASRTTAFADDRAPSRDTSALRRARARFARSFLFFSLSISRLESRGKFQG